MGSVARAMAGASSGLIAVRSHDRCACPRVHRRGAAGSREPCNRRPKPHPWPAMKPMTTARTAEALAGQRCRPRHGSCKSRCRRAAPSRRSCMLHCARCKRASVRGSRAVARHTAPRNGGLHGTRHDHGRRSANGQASRTAGAPGHDGAGHGRHQPPEHGARLSELRPRLRLDRELPERDHLHRRRRRHPAAPGLSDRATGRAQHLHRRRPSSDVRRVPEQGAARGVQRRDRRSRAYPRGVAAVLQRRRCGSSSAAFITTRTRWRCWSAWSDRCRPSITAS